MGAWPDQTAGSPCHRYSRPLAAIEVNDPPAVLNATRIEPLSRTNSIGAFPFLRQPAKSIGLIENRPAPPHRNASRQLKSCKSPSTAKSEALKPSKQTCYRSSSPYQNTSQQHGRSHRSLKRQRAALRCPRSPRKRSDAYFMYASDGLSGEMGCLSAAQRRPVRRSAERRNLISRGIRRGPTSPGTRQRSAGQPEPRRRPCCRHRSWRSGHRARGSSRRAPPGRQA